MQSIFETIGIEDIFLYICNWSNVPEQNVVVGPTTTFGLVSIALVNSFFHTPFLTNSTKSQNKKQFEQHKTITSS